MTQRHKHKCKHKEKEQFRFLVVAFMLALMLASPRFKRSHQSKRIGMLTNKVTFKGKVKRGLIEGRVLTRISAHNSYIYFCLLYR